MKQNLFSYNRLYQQILPLQFYYSYDTWRFFLLCIDRILNLSHILHFYLVDLFFGLLGSFHENCELFKFFGASIVSINGTLYLKLLLGYLMLNIANGWFFFGWHRWANEQALSIVSGTRTGTNGTATSANIKTIDVILYDLITSFTNLFSFDKTNVETNKQSLWKMCPQGVLNTWSVSLKRFLQHEQISSIFLSIIIFTHKKTEN